MSLTEETSEDQKQPEIHLQEDDEMNKSDPEDQKDKNMRTKDFLQTSQRVRRSISPLTLFKEDFCQFKEDVLKVFKDKETVTEREDRPPGQAEGNLVSSTLDLLKEDLSQLKEDVTSVFSIVSSSKDKETKSTEKTVSRLSFLKNDLSNVFKIGLSKERDTAKEDSSDTFTTKVLRAERTDEPSRSLRDQKTSQKAENGQGLKETLSEASLEQTDDDFRRNISEQEERITKDKLDELKDGQLDGTEEKSEEMIPASHTAEQRRESEEWSDDCSTMSAEEERTMEEEEEEDEEEANAEEEEDDENPPETVPWDSLSSVITLFSLRDSNKDDTRDPPGDDLWSVKNFACYLTFDPNTANPELRLTDGNRRATRVWSDLQPSDHPDRFRRCPQVLCREGLLDSVYWEVLWSGGADIGVTYTSISRDGDTASCLLGHNELSWSLECSEGSYTPCHDNKRFRSSSPQPFTHRVGVYLDWSAGSLSFYCVSQDAMVHLHTFTSTFTEPLYPGFWVWAYDGSVSLCQVELDWERLLQ